MDHTLIEKVCWIHPLPSDQRSLKSLSHPFSHLQACNILCGSYSNCCSWFSPCSNSMGIQPLLKNLLLQRCQESRGASRNVCAVVCAIPDSHRALRLTHACFPVAVGLILLKSQALSILLAVIEIFLCLFSYFKNKI